VYRHIGITHALKQKADFMPPTLRFLRSPIVRHFLAFSVAWVVSRTLFAAANFHYDPFTDGFNPAKLAIDFGVWVMIYMVMFRALSRGVKPETPK
jgi:hypothetical protein